MKTLRQYLPLLVIILLSSISVSAQVYNDYVNLPQNIPTITTRGYLAINDGFKGDVKQVIERRYRGGFIDGYPYTLDYTSLSKYNRDGGRVYYNNVLGSKDVDTTKGTVYNYTDGVLTSDTGIEYNYTLNYTYNTQGQLKQTKSESVVTDYTYNDRGYILSKIKSTGAVHKFAYNKDGSMDYEQGFYKDKETSKTSFRFEKVPEGNRVFKTYKFPDKESSTYNKIIDVEGNVIEQDDALGKKERLTYERDARGNVIARHYSIAKTEYEITYWDGTVSKSSTEKDEYKQKVKSKNTSVNINCKSGDCENGYGSMQYDTGDQYEGFFTAGFRDGFGSYLWADGGSYKGAWVNGKMLGYGEFKKKEMPTQIGMFSNGALNGKGVKLIGVTKEEIKIGVFKNGILTVPASLIKTGKETGCTAGDCQSGFGEYKFESGSLFIGFFDQGHFLSGTLLYANGDTYQGEFVNSKREGMGFYYYDSGALDIGMWKNDALSGKAMKMNAQRKVVPGVYENNELVQKL